MATILTLETRPLKKVSMESVAQSLRREVKSSTVGVVEVSVGVKKGIEFHIDSDSASDPKADCWFAIHLRYGWERPCGTGTLDSDVVVTNGDEYYLCRRSLGDTKLRLNPLVQCLIKTAIEEFVKSL